MSYTKLLYHIVFRTHKSQPTIPIDKEKILYTYIWKHIEKQGGQLLRLGGMPDHIHMFVSLPPTLPLADFVRGIKMSTSSFLKHCPDFPTFDGWGQSYCALTYSYLEKDKIINYIKNQKDHHKKISFREEYLNLLKEYGIEPDMTYFLK